MVDFILLVLMLLMCLVGVVYMLSVLQRNRMGIPAGQQIDVDTQEQLGTTLYAHRYSLKGRPDYLIKHGKLIIPVEVKTGRTPQEPYQSHVMQLMAYCLLVAEHYGVRPTYGILRYEHAQYRIEFTSEHEATLLHLLAEMRRQRNQQNVHRSHTNPRLCDACSFRHVCDERLAP